MNDKRKITLKLIEAVKRRPALYCSSHPNNSENYIRNSLWIDIAEEISISDVDVVKSKWKNLKDNYLKRKNAKETNNFPNKKMSSHWIWEENMSFLDKVPSREDSFKVKIEPGLKKIKHSTESSDLLEKGELESSNESYSSEDNDDHRINKKVKQKRKSLFELKQTMKRNSHSSPEVVLANNCVEMDPLSQSTNKTTSVLCDGTDMLFLGYSQTFKGMTKKKRAKVNFQIAKIFMDAELECD